ncbi:cytochrome P450 [Nocardioides mangrovicus]|uniref:Cytochrome P450 n=1 Tax=Nocardioides mangrovicus TaxID=2478913 RepID=A0A3L8P2W2_9ACTN|nr:cytochrome P450 [Nocardioides mangrovicus]RLV49484.1 cytochrome P450 [Nocardioides mangrovicus]
MDRVRQAVGFATALYGDRLRTAVGAYVQRDPFSRLRQRPGRVDPYPVYEHIRARGGWVGTRLGNLATVDHAACDQILRSRRFGVRPEGESGADETGGLSFLNENPPDHGRLRRLAAPAFGARQVAGYRPRIERVVAELLDRAGSRFDLVDDLAAPLPIAVITELLGIPDADATAFAAYGEVVGSALGGIRSLGHARALMRANADLEQIFERLVEERRRRPADDLVSRLAAAEGDALRPGELVPMCTLLLIAGFETTVNLIGNAVGALLDHPDQWALLCEDPSQAGRAAAETLRFDPPVQRTARVSFDEVEVAGRPVASHQVVHVLLGGANRDPAVFTEPDRFDLTRPDAGEHLAFGSGAHHCLGRPLAELEAEIALRVLAERLPRLRRAGPVRLRPATLIRGPLHLPVAA